MDKKKIRLLVQIVAIAIIVVVFIVVNLGISNKRKCIFEAVADNEEWAYQVEEAFLDGDELVVNGWFFQLKKFRNSEKDISIDKERKMAVLLYDVNNGTEKDMDGHAKEPEGILMDVEYTIRNEVNDYFECEYDYSRCGFSARTKTKGLDIGERVYRIVFKPDEESKAGITSNAYLNKGNLTYVSPDDELKLDVEGTDLEKIVNDGCYIAGCGEYHVAIYQYGWSLYWIVDDSFHFDEDGSTYLQYQIDTTQFDRLPKDRTDNGWFWSNISADFEEYEITDKMSCGKYRVSKRDIPTEYAVSVILIGYNLDDSYVWKRFFRPIYSMRQ